MDDFARLSLSANPSAGSATIAVLPQHLKLLTFPKHKLPLCMHGVLRNMLNIRYMVVYPNALVMLRGIRT
jgi:hypothetical protein